MNVSAKDKATGKAQSIVIKASSGLSDEEVQAMVKDAAEHAEDDKKFKELIEVRNHADSLIHSSEKSLKDLADEMNDDEKKSIEAAITDLKEAMKTNEKAQIEEKTANLNNFAGKMAERVYAKKAQAAETPDQATQPGDATNHDGVVDAEFAEVKDKE